jgi:hypothetical protein
MSFFKKQVSHQLTYTSGGRQSQIDYTLYRRKNLGEVKDCKVVPGECVSNQQHVVITKLKIQTKKRKSITKSEPKIKWWKLKINDNITAFRQE